MTDIAGIIDRISQIEAREKAPMDAAVFSIDRADWEGLVRNFNALELRLRAVENRLAVTVGTTTT